MAAVTVADEYSSELAEVLQELLVLSKKHSDKEFIAYVGTFLAKAIESTKVPEETEIEVKNSLALMLEMVSGQEEVIDRLEQRVALLEAAQEAQPPHLPQPYSQAPLVE